MNELELRVAGLEQKVAECEKERDIALRQNRVLMSENIELLRQVHKGIS